MAGGVGDGGWAAVGKLAGGVTAARVDEVWDVGGSAAVCEFAGEAVDAEIVDGAPAVGRSTAATGAGVPGAGGGDIAAGCWLTAWSDDGGGTCGIATEGFVCGDSGRV